MENFDKLWLNEHEHPMQYIYFPVTCVLIRGYIYGFLQRERHEIRLCLHWLTAINFSLLIALAADVC